MEAKAKFISVAHFWAAWCLRPGEGFEKFNQYPEVNYTYADDILSFIAEAEYLGEWGQTWRQERDKSVPPLPDETWRMPSDWHPPQRAEGWPQTGGVPDIAALEEDLARLRPTGRPKKP